MEFKEKDLVMVNHPDYPELRGLAKVTYAKPGRKLVWISLYKDKNERIAHIDYLKLVGRKRAASKS
ncbi:hypothetical protein [Bacillus arachidis]|uniref:Uncharacterized protein n=1 Tax=Bacillus arachidis TaxID=2819290 RepID=A0ABS3P6X8_9BACI|nr:hypothetical protein [Bacillus arachidis]MBO1628621.1 hypothetical protein [Bacillus arachidis]